jgi:hypothetical protein
MLIKISSCLLLLGALSGIARAQGSDTTARRVLAELRQRADSIEHLDVNRELALALARGDRRFIGVRGYVIIAPGVALGDPFYPKQDQMRAVEGTSDHIWAPEVARLNRVASEYASRYNRLLLSRLKSGAGLRSRPSHSTSIRLRRANVRLTTESS